MPKTSKSKPITAEANILVPFSSSFIIPEKNNILPVIRQNTINSDIIIPPYFFFNVYIYNNIIKIYLSLFFLLGWTKQNLIIFLGV
jgi:hypothetical protein